ncbi:MAG: ABC transporter ATP-binding protein [Myxococcota bacterium]
MRWPWSEVPVEPDPDAPSIAASNLTKSFGAVQALAGLSVTIERGELYGLVGPDGAGKTTAVRAIAGLIDVDTGVVRVRGMDPTSRSARESIGLMPQRYALYGDLTIDENLRFFGDLFCVDPEAYASRRDRLLAVTRLAPFVDRRADALSGGMYKKLALSCALLHSPPVLLLDEPTNGVDPVSRRELWALLHEFVADGTTVLVTTPYMDEAERCHRAGILYQGRLLAEGDPVAWAREHGTFEEFFVEILARAAQEAA